MIGLRPAQFRRFFFDRQAVQRAVGRSEADALGFWGGRVRKSAQRNIRDRKRVSKPGQGPTNQTGTLKRFLYYAFDPATRSAVVGPALLNQKFVHDGNFVSGTVPRVLEEGGEIGIFEVLTETYSPQQNRMIWRWRRADLRSKRRIAARRTRTRIVQIAARPYMEPAFRKNLSYLPGAWRNRIKAA